MIAKIKNLEKAAKRIRKAVENKENIIVYGDSDMDGVSSVIILKETISNLGSNAIVYFPDREEEGYGINIKALENLKANAPALFITLDCGISNFKEVDYANKIGFEVVIIDHHEIIDNLPKASIVVDPKQKGDRYPFKEFANVGLAFKLSESIFEGKMAEGIRKNFLELVAMGTIADMMPRIDDNEELVFEGMGYLKESWRPGIQALFTLDIGNIPSLMDQIVRVNSLMNIRSVENGLPAAYRLLTAINIKTAREMAENLLEKNAEKKKKIDGIIREIKKRSSFSKEKMIFDGDYNWELILLGTAASVISKDLNKPVFLYRRKEKESQGSIRAPEGFNTVDAMKSCKDLLVTFGGHARASGFTIENKNLEKFKQCLLDYFNNI